MSQRLPRRILAAISAPAIPVAGLGLPLAVYLPPFYADTVGLGLGAVGTAFLVARIFDVGVDPFFGFLADRTRPPLGRRRFWLVLSLPILLLSSWMIFLPPQGASGVYLLVWILALYIGYTMITISVVSWSAELSGDYDERTRVQSWYQFALMIGLIAVLIVPVIVKNNGGDRWAEMASVGFFIMVLLPICVGFAVTVAPEAKVHEQPEGHWREAIAALLRSKPLRVVLAADFSFGMASGIAASLYIFVIRDGLLVRERYNELLLMFFVIGCLAVPIWMYAACHFEKHKAMMVGAAVHIVAALSFFLVPPGNTLALAAVIVLNALPYASARLLLKSMMADVTDQDRLISGRMQAGLFFSLLLTTEKLGLAIAVGVTFWTLDAIGFRPGSAENSLAVRNQLVQFFVLAPVVFFALGALVLRLYSLDRARQGELRRALTTRFGD